MTSAITVPYNPDLVVKFLSDATAYRYTAKVPIITKGSWKHELYGDLIFDQSSFDQALTNWNSRVLGYEPPLYLGHNVSEDVMEGAAAEGFMENMYQEGDVLFGDFAFVDEDTYVDVHKGKFRYASAEFVSEAKSKETGEPLGLTVTGVALTNRPYLTNMPRVEATQRLSDIAKPFTISFTQGDNPIKDMTVATIEPTTPEFNAAEQFGELAKTVEALRAELNSTKVELDKARTILADQAMQKKLSDVNSLVIEAASKEKFAEMIKEGALTPDQETKLTELMVTLSETNKQKFTAPKGTLNPEASQAPAVENPYAAKIAANKAILAERQKSRQLFVA